VQLAGSYKPRISSDFKRLPEPAEAQPPEPPRIPTDLAPKRYHGEYEIAFGIKVSLAAQFPSLSGVTEEAQFGISRDLTWGFAYPLRLYRRP
jgi:hypothetical protein